MAKKPKTIVMSDLHIGSRDPEYPWFAGEYPDYVAGALGEIANSNDVEDLVFIGDLFDTWLYPLGVAPQSVKEIIADWRQPETPSVIQNMKTCVAQLPNVYYVRGNHDMGAPEHDLDAISADGRKIQCTTPDALRDTYPYMHIEHGHEADMFNAPYPLADDAIGNYPLGFFITRLMANADDGVNARKDFKDVLLSTAAAGHRSLKSMLGNRFVETIIDALVFRTVISGDKVDDETEIRLCDSDDVNGTVTIGHVKEKYGKLLPYWIQKDPVHVGEAMLVALRKAEGLDWYARKKLREHRVPIVVMGHTHHGEVERCRICPRGVYANCGCWCDADDSEPIPTCVEIDRQGKHAVVSLLRWNKDAEQLVRDDKITHTVTISPV